MFPIVVTVLALSLALPQVELITLPVGSPPSIVPTRQYRLCTYCDWGYNKCLRTVETAQSRSVDLLLECVQVDSREACLRAVRHGEADMVMLTGGEYDEGREALLRPAIYERDSRDRSYLAVVPRNISVIDVFDAPLEYDTEDEDAVLAAAYVSTFRNRDPCATVSASGGSGTTTIRIVDSTTYTPTDDEILLCPGPNYAPSTEYENCNFNTGLQRAAFVRLEYSPMAVLAVQHIFHTILEQFGPQSPYNGEHSFNFFDTFNGRDDIIFRNNAIGFDLTPTYTNGITEEIFRQLICPVGEQAN